MCPVLFNLRHDLTFPRETLTPVFFFFYANRNEAVAITPKHENPIFGNVNYLNIFDLRRATMAVRFCGHKDR